MPPIRFFSDLHPTMKAEFVLANPPFNLSGWGADKLAGDVRWQYGLPPAGNANFAWLQHMIFHLSEHGRMGMVLANGSLSSQSSGEGDIRKNIVLADLGGGHRGHCRRSFSIPRRYPCPCGS